MISRLVFVVNEETGGSALTMEWFPTPTYMCRRWLALQRLANIHFQGRFLEIGVGAGDFLAELARRGFCGLGIDLSEEGIEHAESRIGRFGADIDLRRLSFFDLEENFGIVFCFEVLEHFEDDTRVLAKMNALLAHGGHLMLSVPARMKHWGPNDEWAGHVRRYEKDELVEKAESCGFAVVSVDSFGVPLANVMKIFYDRLIAARMSSEARLEPEARSERSWAIPLGKVASLAVSVLTNRAFMLPFLLLQCLFLGTDLGTGYLVIFRKVSEVSDPETIGALSNRQ